MPKKGQSPDTFPVDSEYLRRFAAKLEYVARRYREISEGLGNQEVQVTGRPTAERSRDLLVSWMATLQRGVDNLALEDGSEIGRELINEPKPKKAKK